MYNATDEQYTSTMIWFIVNMVMFTGLVLLMVRGLTSRKGLFSSFRSICVGIVILGVLLLWQNIMDQSILLQMADDGYDTSDIYLSFSNLGYVIYFLGILVTGAAIFRNKRDLPRWFPARK
jgi:uncharacterized membrane protein